MQNFSISPVEMVSSFWRNRALIGALAKRDLIGRYRGSIMGMLWPFFHPIAMLAVYTFVFGVVFKARWNAGSESKEEFALVLFAGLLVFNLFAECVNRGPGLILSNVSYVKKVVFPLEILPWVALTSAFFHFLMSLAVWFVFHGLFFGTPKPSALLLPVVLLPLIFATIGITWFLASLGVFLRDVAQIVGIATTAAMFLSPVFYPMAALPEPYQTIFSFNPLTPAIEQARLVLIWGRIPVVSAWVVGMTASLLIGWLGFAWFQKTRKGFADVL